MLESTEATPYPWLIIGNDLVKQEIVYLAKSWVSTSTFHMHLQRRGIRDGGAILLPVANVGT